jgi:hypothetical protein
MIRAVVAALGLLALSACTGAKGKPPPPASVSANPAPPPVFRPPPPGDMVLGQSAAAVKAALGAPRLDIREGAARKLQFVGEDCIADVYFYAPRIQAEPVATHIDTRGREGEDVERAGCISALAAR